MGSLKRFQVFFLLVQLCFFVQIYFPGGRAQGADPLVAVTTDRDGVWVFHASESGTFGGGVFIPVGAGVEPWHLLAADLDGDRLPDLVSACRYGPSVAVFRNTGSGFEDPVLYDAGPKPYHTEAGDFDGDGDLDLAVANPVQNGLLVFLMNKGDGTFVRGDQLRLGDGTYASAAADIDRDGYVDLAVVNHGTNEIVLLMGQADGTLTVKKRLPSEGGPKDVVFGRFNDDDLPDLAVVNYEGASVRVFVNDGGGVFDPGRSYPAGVLPRHLVAADLSNDGLDDLVVAGGKGSEEIFVLYCNGDDDFTAAQAYQTGPRPNGVWAYDVDGDGYRDILAANWSLGNESLASVTVLRNEGKADSFQRLQDFKPPQGFAKVTYVIAGRFFATGFVRGDVTGEGKVNISDAIATLRFLFGLKPLGCTDAADVDDNGMVNVADPIRILAFLFGGGPPPSPPFPQPGPDPTPDDLTCRW